MRRGFCGQGGRRNFYFGKKSGRAVPFVCASSGLWSIVPSALVTSYLAAQSEQNVLERIQALNEKVYEQLRQSLSNEGAKSELERLMTSGISKSVSNETLCRNNNGFE